jgi:hypothetical protein
LPIPRLLHRKTQRTHEEDVLSSHLKPMTFFSSAEKAGEYKQ